MRGEVALQEKGSSRFLECSMTTRCLRKSTTTRVSIWWITYSQQGLILSSIITKFRVMDKSPDVEIFVPGCLAKLEINIVILWSVPPSRSDLWFMKWAPQMCPKQCRSHSSQVDVDGVVEAEGCDQKEILSAFSSRLLVLFYMFRIFFWKQKTVRCKVFWKESSADSRCWTSSIVVAANEGRPDLAAKDYMLHIANYITSSLPPPTSLLSLPNCCPSTHSFIVHDFAHSDCKRKYVELYQ